MVSVSTIVAALSMAVSTTSASSLSALPTFDVPAFDYATLTQGDAPHRMLQALQNDGIIALKNVPNYANLRERYLREAAQCAAVTSEADATFVNRKLFSDGTKRATISTNAGRELAGAASEVDAKCPGYRALYEEFSQTLEHAVNTFGATLDKTAFTASDGHKTVSSRQLVSDAVRLDHFHAYEAAPSSSSNARGVGMSAETHRQLELSLPLHEDHGLFIAMSAPKYFEVDATGRHLVERELAADASGLVIQTSSGDRVRPVLKADEVVLMMGTGASRWLKTSHALPAVMHGMKMPEAMVSSSEAGRRSLRAWFGKMTLLPAYQRMLESKLPFEEHVNATTRFLLTSQDADMKTVGCATGRHLEASATTCVRKQCTTKPGQVAPEETCQTVCNRVGHADSDPVECAKQCTCTDIAGSAEVCWMLCVSHLPECSASNQKCSGQDIKCPVTPPTTAPAPTTKAPSPVTSSPAPGPGPAPGPAPGPGPAPAPGPGPTSAPAPGPGPTTKAPSNGASPSPSAGSATSTPSASSVAGPTSKPPTNGPSSSSQAGSTTTAPAADGTTPAPQESSSAESSTTSTPSGSTAGSEEEAEPQVSASTSAPSTPASTTAAPKSGASVVLMSSAVAMVGAAVSTLLL